MIKRTLIRVTAGTLLIAVVGLVRISTTPVLADSLNPIIVNSTADTTANDGKCTLREAITSANTDTASGAAGGECIAGSGTDSIDFNITGAANYTLTDRDGNSKNGYTITPNSGLPTITEPVTIDGYSQSGALVNNATAPNPLNGTLLIQVSGTNAGNTDAFQFVNNSDGSTLKGLVVNNFANGDAVKILANTIKVQGNYIGTDPTSFTARPNVVGVNAAVQNIASGHNALIGGLNPADRNLISGNTAGTTGTAGYPGAGWTIQGNYVGIAADGLTPVANSTAGGSGSFSIDDNQDVTVGGSQPGAINVIGESLGHGLAPDHTTNLLIEGNYIGLGYDGTTVLGNSHGLGSGASGAGFAISNVDNATIKNNRVAGWQGDGIALNGGNSNITVENNIVYDNVQNGIAVQGNTITIHGNTSYDNGGSNLSIAGFSAFGLPIDGVTVSANKIGLLPSGMPASHNHRGISIGGDPANVMIGGAHVGDGNIVSANLGEGIMVNSLTVTAFSATITPESVSILGNSIYSNGPALSGPFSNGGLGIDLLDGFDTDSSPDGIPNSYTNIGPTLNDTGDSDTGPNGYINFPVLTSATQFGTNLNLGYNLDASDSPSNSYRVEFFSNDTADASGYGEGQTFLGTVTSTNGTGKNASLTLPSGLNLSGKVLSATTTAINNTTTSGFGSTSEFSSTIPVAVLSAAITNPLAPNTGIGSSRINIKLLLIFGAMSVPTIYLVTRSTTKRRLFTHS